MSSMPLHYSQNFLRDPHLVVHLIDLSSIGPDDTVVEIGPGKGIITDRLAQCCRRVIAIEKDRALADRLRCRYAAQPHVVIHTGDFLAFPLPESPYNVFASIPFSITHAIVTKLTGAPCPPQEACLIMQREAAEKFCGVPHESLYAVLLKPWFDLDILYHFRRDDFHPAPRVDVVMLRLRKRGPPLLAPHERQLFRDFAAYGFTTRQPTLDRILRDILTHRQRRQAAKFFAIDFAATPSATPFHQWLQLFRYFTQVANTQTIQRISGSEQRLRLNQARLHKVHRTRPVPQG
jgi:23S rRNA (adenine-N6)-dimethyltransferase